MRSGGSDEHGAETTLMKMNNRDCCPRGAMADGWSVKGEDVCLTRQRSSSGEPGGLGRGVTSWLLNVRTLGVIVVAAIGSPPGCCQAAVAMEMYMVEAGVESGEGVKWRCVCMKLCMDKRWCLSGTRVLGTQVK